MTNLNHPKIQQLQQLIDSAEIVSFDVFDTLLVRPFVQPHHLFHMMQHTLAKKLNDPYLDFPRSRMLAERNARTKLKAAHGYEDINLEEIYQELAAILHIDTKVAAEIKAQEIQLEMDVCSPHPIMKEMYELAKKKGKRIILISDMYLSTSELNALVKHNGYEGHEKVYVSADERLTKHMGTIFPHVMNDLGVKAESMVHIGDNHIADIKMAKKHNIPCFHMPKVMEAFNNNERNLELWQNIYGTEDKAESMALGLMAKKLFANAEDIYSPKSDTFVRNWERFGYQLVGPLYLSFIQWLIVESRKAGLEKLLFLSRDGYIMQQVYEKVAPFYENAPDHDYVYASRRALWIPRLDKLDSFTLNFLGYLAYPPMSVGNYLRRINLNPEDYTEILARHGFDSLDHTLKFDEEVIRLQAFFVDIKDDLQELSMKERDVLLDYYKQVGIGEDNNIAIVDIGWNGSMQFALNDLMGRTQKAPIGGYYLGTYASTKRLTDFGLPVHGFLFEKGQPFENVETLMQCIEIIELIFSAPHGTLIHFKREGDKVVPVLDESDCSDHKLQILEEIHKGAHAFIDDFLELAGKETPAFQLEPHTIMKPLEALLFDPTLEEVGMFMDLIHTQDITKDEVIRHIVEKPPKLYFFRPFALAHAYKRAYWKAGFIKSLGKFGRQYFMFIAKLNYWMKRSKQKLVRMLIVRA